MTTFCLAAGLAPRFCRIKRGASPAANRRRPAFTLLEVVLALAILVAGLAVIGQLADQGLRSAHDAAALAQAQLLCESKMAELAAGLVPLSAVSGVPIETDPEWMYSITVDPTIDEGLLAVRVSVVENLPPEQRPTEFTLVRWMIDPATETSP